MPRLLGATAVLVLALVGFYFFLAESGEVVVLETPDGAGVRSTRLWVVDHAGAAWLRTGNPESPWLASVRRAPEVAVTRRGERRAYRAVVVEDAAARERINALTLEKYGWREAVLRALMMDPALVTPIRLEPEPR